MGSTGQCLIMATLPPLPLAEMQASRSGRGMKAEVPMEEEQAEGEEELEASLLSQTLRSAPST